MRVSVTCALGAADGVAGDPVGAWGPPAGVRVAAADAAAAADPLDVLTGPAGLAPCIVAAGPPHAASTPRAAMGASTAARQNLRMGALPGTSGQPALGAGQAAGMNMINQVNLLHLCRSYNIAALTGLPDTAARSIH